VYVEAVLPELIDLRRVCMQLHAVLPSDNRHTCLYFGKFIQQMIAVSDFCLTPRGVPYGWFFIKGQDWMWCLARELGGYHSCAWPTREGPLRPDLSLVSSLSLGSAAGAALVVCAGCVVSLECLPSGVR